MGQCNPGNWLNGACPRADRVTYPIRINVIAQSKVRFLPADENVERARDLETEAVGQPMRAVMHVRIFVLQADVDVRNFRGIHIGRLSVSGQCPCNDRKNVPELGGQPENASATNGPGLIDPCQPRGHSEICKQPG